MDLFNNANPLGQLGSSSGSKKNQRPKNFIETLKDIGSSGKQQTKDLIFGAQGAKKPSTGEAGKKDFNFEEYLKSQTTSNLSGEVKKATLQAVVEPGTYHETFFDRIRKLIELARKKLAESETWMQIFNNRSQKRSHYWGQVKKSGTKYMLSQERYMATQVG